MTTTKNQLKSIAVLIAIFIATNSYGITYSTLTNGAWDNTTNVWSTDGVTPCGCTPGATSGGNDIIVNHIIAAPYNLVFNGGSTVTVGLGAEINGGFNINMWNSTFDVSGNLTIGKFSQGAGGNTTIKTGVLMILSNSFNINGGNFLNDGGLMNSGGIGIASGANVTLINASKMHVISGNLTNGGNLSIGPDCCMSSNGNWKNNATGTVSGTGSVFSGGNINNQGVWDINIVWCSTGGDLGMPSPENCAASTGICGAIVLPVELIYFDAQLSEYANDAELTWETATEYNSAFFYIERSLDLENWTQIGQVEAAGYSSDRTQYNFTDYDLKAGTYFYRLVQADIDDTRTESYVKTVTVENASSELTVHPNPASASQPITIGNVQSGDIITIRNMAGSVVLQQDVFAAGSSIQLSTVDLTPGIYFINTQRGDSNETVKLIISQR